jgi:hypothetical protein
VRYGRCGDVEKGLQRCGAGGRERPRTFGRTSQTASARATSDEWIAARASNHEIAGLMPSGRVLLCAQKNTCGSQV